MNNIVKELQAEMKHAIADQDELYERIMFPAIVSGDPAQFAAANQEYTEALGGFDARAYQKVVNTILDDEEHVIDLFSDQFQSIPKYLNARNNFSDKIKLIMEQDGSPHDKQQMIDALDRSRTAAHNGVISLFNDLNDYAREHDLTPPYPNNNTRYDGTKPHDRDAVANLLTKQTTLFECSNRMVQEKFKTTGRTESIRDLYRTMSPTAVLRKIAEGKGVDLSQLVQETIDHASR